MQKVIKGIKLLGLALLVGILLTAISVKAQSPADDPGIGGPGSPSIGVGADSGPVVPFDGGMSLLFAASGVTYVSRKLRDRKKAVI